MTEQTKAELVQFLDRLAHGHEVYSRAELRTIADRFLMLLLAPEDVAH